MCKENERSLDIDQFNAYYGLEEHLKSFRDISLYEKLCCSWEVDKQCYINSISTIAQRFPHYSDHGELHSKKIISSIEFILGKKRIKQLSVSDTWLLLQCAYTHDLGMSISANDLIRKMAEEKDFYEKIKNMCQKEDGLKESFEFIQPLFEYYVFKRKEELSEDFDEYIVKTSLSQRLDAKAQYDIFRSNDLARWPIKLINAFSQILEAYARPHHGDYSEEMLMEDFSQICENGIVPIRLRYLVARISAFHMKNRECLLDEFPRETLGICNDYMNPRFAAIMLRLGDLLDLDNGRFNQKQLNILGETPYTTSIHQFKHEAITHFLITPLEISVKANFTLRTAEKLLSTQTGDRSKKVILNSEKKKLCMKACKSLNEWLEMLRAEIEFLSINWLSIVPRKFEGSCPNFVEPVLMIDGVVVQKHELNLSYEITTKRSAEIIEGAGLYSEPQFVFLREVLQNALDATKVQMYLDVASGMYPNFIDESGRVPYETIKKLTPFCFTEKLKHNLQLYRIEYSIKPNTQEKTVKISIRDYGIGITYKDLQGMLKIGNSNKTELEDLLIDIPDWLKPTGSFGIGLQSIFYVAKSFKIRSRPRYEKEHIRPPLREMVFFSTRLGGEIEVTLCDEAQANKFGYGTEVIIEIDFKDNKDKLLLYANRTIHNDGNKYFDMFCENLEQICIDYIQYIKKLYSCFIIQLKEKCITSSSAHTLFSTKEALQNQETNMIKSSFGSFCILHEYGSVKSDNECLSSEFSCWSGKYKILIKYKPSITPYDGKSNFSIYYKGILVNSDRIKELIRIPFWDTEIHLFSEYANAILEISRDEILVEKVSEIADNIHKVHFCCLKFLFNSENIKKYKNEFAKIWTRETLQPGNTNSLYTAQSYLSLLMFFISNKEKADVELRDSLMYCGTNVYNEHLIPYDAITYFVMYPQIVIKHYIERTHELSAFCNMVKEHIDKIWFVANRALPHCDLSLQYSGNIKSEDSLVILEDYFYNYPQFAANEFKILLVSGWSEPVIIYKICRRNGELVKSDEKNYWKLCIRLYKSAIKNCQGDANKKKQFRLVFPSNPLFEKISVTKLVSGIEHKEITKFNSYIISPLSLYDFEELICNCNSSETSIEILLDKFFSKNWINDNALLLEHITSFCVKKSFGDTCVGIEDNCNLYLSYKAFLQSFLEKYYQNFE